MTPVSTPDTAFALRRAWMQAERQFASLPVRPGEVDGDKVLYSYWVPSIEERQLILQGAAVRLCCVADEHPPVAVEVITFT
jgi:hypothetical protein